jgi:hypothetical protein
MFYFNKKDLNPNSILNKSDYVVDYLSIAHEGLSAVESDSAISSAVLQISALQIEYSVSEV